MMVIKGRITGATLDEDYYFPIDKCVWNEDSTFTGDGYRITSTRYVDGGNAVPVAGVTAAQFHSINNPVIGFIGKSGRFVGNSVEHPTA